MNHLHGPLDRPNKLMCTTLAIALGLVASPFLSGRLNASAFTPSSKLSSPRKLVGTLEPTLIPSERGVKERLMPATNEERAALPGGLAAASHAFVGNIQLTKGKFLKLALIEPAQSDPYAFADVDLDGRFEASERFTFAQEKPSPQLILQVQLPIGPFKVYPVRLLLPPAGAGESSGKNGRTVFRSFFVFVQGVVRIGGKPVRTLYSFDGDKAAADPDNGWMGMDTDGDGIVDQFNFNEFTYAKNEVVLFHVNDHDVSTTSIDLKSGTFVVLEHRVGSNSRISLRVGDTLTDFAFTGMDEKSHHFSDFRGNYVLLDFWETSCPPAGWKCL